MAESNNEKISTDAVVPEKKETQIIKPLSAISHRMFHPPKLERKHSSGDLHSRLKTRKILGVGETDNGDIHRSKISQLLGHNEHLYVKFPRGYWAWHLSHAILLSILGLRNLFFPEGATDSESSDASILQVELAYRFYGCASLALAFLAWSFWGTNDKGVARTLLVAVAMYNSLQIIALTLSHWESEWSWLFVANIFLRTLLVLPNAYFYRNIGFCGLRMRKSTSFNSLKDCGSSNNHFKKLD